MKGTAEETLIFKMVYWAMLSYKNRREEKNWWMSKVSIGRSHNKLS